MKTDSSFHLSKCLLFALGIGAASITSAVPVTYEFGALQPGETRVGAIGDPSLTGTPFDDFWYFSGVQGKQIKLTGNRLDPGLDLAMKLYFGFDTDTNQLMPIVIAAADDNYLELPGFAGPWADPQIIYTLQFTGTYTVQMWDYDSTPVPPGTLRCYQVTLDGEPPGPVGGVAGCGGTVSEPGSLSLFGIALAGLLGAMSRRRLA